MEQLDAQVFGNGIVGARSSALRQSKLLAWN